MQSFSASEVAHVVDRLTDSERKQLLEGILTSIWPLFPLVPPKPQEDPMKVSVDILDDGIAVNGYELLGGVGLLLKLAVIKDGDGEDDGWPREWHWAFHDSPRPARFTTMNGAAKARIEQEFSRPLVYVQCAKQGHSRARKRMHSLFALVKGPQVELAGHVADARRAWEDARDLLKAGRSGDAAESVIRAVSLCSLLCRPYEIARECVRYPAGHRALVEDDASRGVLQNGVYQLRQWLDWLHDGFDFNVIPPEYHERVRTGCLREIHIVRKKLETLSEALGGRQVASSLPTSPLNIFLAAAREMADTPDIPWTEQELLPKETTAQLKAIGEEVTKRVASRKSHLLTDATVKGIYACLHLAAGNPDFRFPEPDGTSDRWRTESIRIWRDLFFKHYDDGPNPNDSRLDDIGEPEDDSDPDGSLL